MTATDVKLSAALAFEFDHDLDYWRTFTNEVLTYITNLDTPQQKSVWQEYNRCLLECNRWDGFFDDEVFYSNNNHFWNNFKNYPPFEILCMVTKSYSTEDPYLRVNPASESLAFDSYSASDFFDAISKEAENETIRLVLRRYVNNSKIPAGQIPKTLHFFNQLYQAIHQTK